MELPDPMGLVVVRRLALRLLLRLPARPANRADRQRTELVERERAIRMMFDNVFDPLQLGVPVRVVRFLPRLGPLRRDLVVNQHLAEPFPPITPIGEM